MTKRLLTICLVVTFAAAAQTSGWPHMDDMVTAVPATPADQRVPDRDKFGPFRKRTQYEAFAWCGALYTARGMETKDIAVFRRGSALSLAAQSRIGKDRVSHIPPLSKPALDLSHAFRAEGVWKDPGYKAMDDVCGNVYGLAQGMGPMG